jgi:hypothetical protein
MMAAAFGSLLEASPPCGDVLEVHVGK